jgi:hypothetical protein
MLQISCKNTFAYVPKKYLQESKNVLDDNLSKPRQSAAMCQYSAIINGELVTCGLAGIARQCAICRTDIGTWCDAHDPGYCNSCAS